MDSEIDAIALKASSWSVKVDIFQIALQLLQRSR